MLCAYLSIALLVGLGANALLGLWWADPLAGLAIAAIAVREAREAWRRRDVRRLLLTVCPTAGNVCCLTSRS